MQNRFAELGRRNRYLQGGVTNKPAVAEALLLRFVWRLAHMHAHKHTRMFSCMHALT